MLRENKIVYEYVPNNMSVGFQVLDLTFNKWKKMFIEPVIRFWFFHFQFQAKIVAEASASV